MEHGHRFTQEGQAECRAPRRRKTQGDTAAAAAAAAAVRRRRLLALQAEADVVVAAVDRLRDETARLQGLETQRRLTPAARSALKRLRVESEGLYLRLKGLRQEFEALRSARR